jgi:quercetin dioxygenase-like cupin family protein
VFFEPGENHWQGAASNPLMVRIAIQQVDEDGSAGTFGDPVTDAQYNGTTTA